MKLLELRNISKRFDSVMVVDDLSFGIERGTITALIGPNGSGKTVTFNLITGFYRPASGGIYFKGQEITRLAPHKIFNLGIGRTFQNVRLFPQMTVLENILLGIKHDVGVSLWDALLRTSAMRKAEKVDTERAMELLKFIGLEGKRDEVAEKLSFGQRRLLEFARTLGSDSELYLLDEPTAGIFPSTIPKLFEIIESLKNRGKTILLIEHNMKVVMDVSDKIIVLNYGKKITEGVPGAIQNNEAVLQAYMGKGRRAR